ncbi:BZ3500_MvSof-1268-A1-R1_Chr5-2g07722 [Microbotryum saponariae]|uniref:BZ3500_MvSof-1268-A1-R1_Chr5-2g07722 protein n=1 Tax=Microbotryum saponariae TaxID=289078 RepID=A0A2X0LF90_9BASI|nr:BZ3500_MvSof-1268-A1-R1_Chr5-2g07722 [Microbotryum saponariae]SDA05591.1 BZ3501_MvSof-1269-A2-R1_Chr5-2g07544 [Microbotryum saponariae]
MPQRRRTVVPFPIADDPDQSTGGRTELCRTPAELPADHFLAPRPAGSNLTQPESHNSPDHDSWQRRARPDTSSLAAADYDVSVATGFLPPDEPVQQLQLGIEWQRFERLLEMAQKEVSRLVGGGVGRLSESWRRHLRELPQPPIYELTSLPLLRRAHVVLTYLAHFYTHAVYPYDTHIPATVSVPLVEISKSLGLPPILTYADTVLWNWHLLDRSRGIRADNMAITTTFTSSDSEKAFFFLSILCELHGPIILRSMSSTLDEAFFADRTALVRIAGHLDNIASALDELALLLHDSTRGAFGPAPVRASISAPVFYWEIRPWFNGGRWMYEGVGEREYGGPSAGQSSLVHAVDLFLGIDHSPRPTSTTSTASVPASSGPPKEPSATLPSSVAQAKGLSDDTFMMRMSTYMPGHHRAFLAHLASLYQPTEVSEVGSAEKLPSVRDLVIRHPQQLQESYDRAVLSMKKFRDEHMKLATVYIVAQAKKEPGRQTVFWQEWEDKRIEKERLRQEESRGRREVLKGTGGTDLIVFLKMCRERTKEALLG